MGRALEDELFQSISTNGAKGLLDRAIALKEVSLVNDHIKSVSANATDLETIQMDLILDEITDDTRVLLGAAAKCGTGWFKNITAMEGIAREVVGPRLADCAENFRNKIKSIFDWIADDDE